MKICFAIHHFLPNYTGGAEWETLRLAAGLQSRGHQVYILAVERIDQGADGGGLTWQDDFYAGLPVRRLFFDRKAAADPFRWDYDHPWIGEAVQTWLDEIRPDIFHLVSGYLLGGSSLQAAQAMGIKTVVSLMDFWFLCPRISMLRSNGGLSTLPIRAATCARCLGEEQRRYRLPGQIAPGLMSVYWQHQDGKIAQVQARMDYLREVLERTDILISASQFLRGLFIQAGINPEKILQLRQGLDFPPRREKTPSDRLRVGYIGQIAQVKGVHVLLQALKLIPNADLSLTLYGDIQRHPEYTSKLKQIAGQDERITFAGSYHTPDEEAQALRGLDVIVVPSLWYENSPNVILEAFASGTPVIASDLGGMAELVQDGVNGLLFIAGDAADLAGKLNRLAVGRDLLQQITMGISPVKSVSQAIDETIAVYAGLVGILTKG